jgi:hypothetical protein
MSGDWWQQGYPGGPMVAVHGFPRPLYPPDANRYGKKPSADGPDVVAYKRTVSRAGRWPWQAFDDSFNNAFSHGKPQPEGMGVSDSGVAGTQRQGNIEDTGYIGQATFNLLRSIRIPDGLPHAGEPAMDVTAVKLINQAWEIYGGHPDPAPPSAGSGRDGLAAHFAKREGYTEQPADSNCDNRSDGIRTAQDKTAGGGTWLRYQPWCGCWCYYALDAVGVTGMDSGMASVATIEDNARAKRAPFTGWTTDRSHVRLGDLVVIGGRGVHVETVRGFSGSTTLTWGGNTSAGSSGSQSNGGGAYQRSRTPSEVYGYALVRYPGE